VRGALGVTVFGAATGVGSFGGAATTAAGAAAGAVLSLICASLCILACLLLLGFAILLSPLTFSYLIGVISISQIWYTSIIQGDRCDNRC
jgi:hypothetical protein